MSRVRTRHAVSSTPVSHAAVGLSLPEDKTRRLQLASFSPVKYIVQPISLNDTGMVTIAERIIFRLCTPFNPVLALSRRTHLYGDCNADSSLHLPSIHLRHGKRNLSTDRNRSWPTPYFTRLENEKTFNPATFAQLRHLSIRTREGLVNTSSVETDVKVKDQD